MEFAKFRTELILPKDEIKTVVLRTPVEQFILLRTSGSKHKKRTTRSMG